MINSLIILAGKTLSFISRSLNLGHGSTWPGHIALFVNKNFIKDILGQPKTKDQRPKTILIAGTNGKTTTGKLIRTILEKDGKKVFQNESGANLLNGIASSIVLHSNILGAVKYDYAIFETDENSLPLILKEFTPDYIILLNLFRDQLDRYGEVNTIAKNWGDSLKKLSQASTLILNADDPQIAYLGLSLNRSDISYFGLNDISLSQTKLQYASDSTYCPNCKTKLIYEAVYFSHLGIWHCSKCKLKRPQVEDLKFQTYPLSGAYNKYNLNAAILLIKVISFAKSDLVKLQVEDYLKDFKPAFGRQEIIEVNGKKVQIFLSKNPTSFNQSLQTIIELGAKNILFVLNDRIPDGRDVSWIWDVDFEEYLNGKMNIIVSGDRAFDLGLRIKYASKNQKGNLKNQNQNLKFKTYENLKEAVNESLKEVQSDETLFVLPTYSAMLEVRKILTGKKIL